MEYIRRKNSVEQEVHVFIVGSKGIPAQYGGFETFVENLTARKGNKRVKYHVSCMNNKEKHFSYNNADCFNVKVPALGAFGRILHVSRVLSQIERWKKKHRNESTIVYILGCRIGPFLRPHARKLRKQSVKIFVNPDGLEWKRDKWNHVQKKILKICEKCLVTNADLVVCDSINIEKYIQENYPRMKDKTTYIAYGADTTKSECSKDKMDRWLEKCNVKRDNYYLIVGRFVPENNYETMILEFMKSSTQRDLVIISNVEKNKFYSELKVNTNFETDQRIKFVGTVYDKELLKNIRESAFAYIHGHEVGGTNPSLLEALASTKLNLLLNVGFNKEVGKDGALYWNKKIGNLAGVIGSVEKLKEKEIEQYDSCSTKRVEQQFSWKSICDSYEQLWINEKYTRKV